MCPWHDPVNEARVNYNDNGNNSDNDSNNAKDDSANAKDDSNDNDNDSLIIGITHRKGYMNKDEESYINALNDEFDKRTLGIKPHTSKFPFITWAINRQRNAITEKVRKRLNPIVPSKFTGLVRDRGVTERLKIHRLKLGSCNMPSVDELLAHFMPGQHVQQTLLLKPNAFLSMKTVAIPKEHMPPKGIKPLSGGRVSSFLQESDGEGLEDQTTSLQNFAYKHHPDSIPPQGMTWLLLRDMFGL